MRLTDIALGTIAHLGVALLAFAVTGLYRRYAVARGVIDLPTNRSSHVHPTPRGGGISIVLCVLGASAAALMRGAIPAQLVIAVCGLGALIAVAGLIDDHVALSAKWRFLVQTFAAVTVVWMLGGMGHLTFGATQIQLGVIGDVVAVLFLVWLTNLFNFMDGIDGIAGVESATVAFSAGVLLWLSGQADQALLMSIVGAASLGFLVWNWPPAKIFMGDVGSGFLGFAFGAMAIATHANKSLDIWVWLVILGVFVVDATLTLIRRVMRGERFYEAHRSHAYQHAASRLGSHKPVTLAVAGINIVWLLPIAALITSGTIAGIYGFLVAYVPLLWLAAANRAGCDDNASD
jgi:Fuc2NAc and GlcNAc transferase